KPRRESCPKHRQGLPRWNMYPTAEMAANMHPTASTTALIQWTSGYERVAPPMSTSAVATPNAMPLTATSGVDSGRKSRTVVLKLLMSASFAPPATTSMSASTAVSPITTTSISLHPHERLAASGGRGPGILRKWNSCQFREFLDLPSVIDEA